MSRFNLLFIPIFLITSVLLGQEKTSIVETQASISNASGNALSVKINRADEKTILKEWKSLMKKHNGDVKIKGNEALASNVIIEAISGHEIKVYAQLSDVNNTIRELKVIFLNGDRAISSKNDVAGYTAAKIMMENFANDLSKEASEEYKEKQVDLLDEKQKLLEENKAEIEDAKEEIEDAEKAIKDAEESIKNSKELIKDKEYKIEELKKKQTEIIKEIDAQKEKLDQAKDEESLFN